MYWTPLYAVMIGSFLIWSSYYTIARIFKWLTLVLFSYVLAAFLAKPDWAAVLRSTFIPHVEWSGAYWATLVGHLRNHHFSLPVLLAGVAGSGGRARSTDS